MFNHNRPRSKRRFFQDENYERPARLPMRNPEHPDDSRSGYNRNMDYHSRRDRDYSSSYNSNHYSHHLPPPPSHPQSQNVSQYQSYNDQNNTNFSQVDLEIAERNNLIPPPPISQSTVNKHSPPGLNSSSSGKSEYILPPPIVSGSVNDNIISPPSKPLPPGTFAFKPPPPSSSYTKPTQFDETSSENISTHIAPSTSELSLQQTPSNSTSSSGYILPPPGYMSGVLPPNGVLPPPIVSSGPYVQYSDTNNPNPTNNVNNYNNQNNRNYKDNHYKSKKQHLFDIKPPVLLKTYSRKVKYVCPCLYGGECETLKTCTGLDSKKEDSLEELEDIVEKDLHTPIIRCDSLTDSTQIVSDSDDGEGEDAGSSEALEDGETDIENDNDKDNEDSSDLSDDGNFFSY